MKKPGTRNQEPGQPNKFFLLLCSLFFILCSLPSSLCHFAEAASADRKSYVYNIYWSGIKAGTAVMDYENASSGMTITTHATSAPVISIFYKVDDTAQSVLYPDGYPKKYFIKVHEGRHRRDKSVVFEPWTDKKPQKVIYYDKIDDEKVDFFLDKPAHDPLSAFYAMTRTSLEVGRSEFIDVFDSKKVWRTEVKILRKEKIRVQSREFNTIVIQPLLKSEGIFRRAGDIFIWVTDDDRKIPVLFRSKAVIGSFTLELTEGDI